MRISRHSYCGLNSTDEYYAMLAEAGWQGIDMDEPTYEELYSLSFGEAKNKIGEATDFIKRNGMTISQIHAPFYGNTPVADTPGERVEKAICDMITCIRIANELDIPYVVVHPILYSWSRPDPDRKKTLDFNAEYLHRLCKVAENTTVCLENMPGPNGFINDGKTMREMVDTVNEKNLAVCLDTGHLISVNGKTSEFFKENPDKVKTLHVHDSVFGTDMHDIAYSHSGDWWADFEYALKNYGFNGSLSSESCFAVRMPKEMRLQAEKYEAELFKRIAEKSS